MAAKKQQPKNTKKQAPKKQATKKAPAKKAAAKSPAKKKPQSTKPKAQAQKKVAPRKATTELLIEIQTPHTPQEVAKAINTATQTAYSVFDDAKKSISSTVVRVDDIARKTLRQKMLAWFKR